MKFIITMLLAFLVTISSVAYGCKRMTYPSSSSNYPSQFEGRNYYLLEEGFTCRANAPGKPTIKSWKNHIEFRDNKVLIWQTICNDNPIIKKFNARDFKFIDNGSSLIYQSEKYSFYPNKPALCETGQWCPTTEE